MTELVPEFKDYHREHWESLDFKSWGELWRLETEAREKQALLEWVNIMAKIVRKLNDGD